MSSNGNIEKEPTEQFNVLLPKSIYHKLKIYLAILDKTNKEWLIQLIDDLKIPGLSLTPKGY